ncbi:MAG: mismatch-specific DNA-glycosylase [Actinobacteria bacterium]|nr:mismatch-specific DNA-glycosylase [Actinomycetota bacterium]
MGFTRAELESFQGATVPDLVGDDVRLVFVGINPGLWTAATATHFAHPGNRFYPALFEAGITDRLIDASDGWSDEDRRHLLDRGIAITNLCRRATARADELSPSELRDGALEVESKIEALSPRAVAVVGLTAYRTAFGRPRAPAGRQDEYLGGAPLWVLPNPSGLNAHETVASLARAYREPAEHAGLLRT